MARTEEQALDAFAKQVPEQGLGGELTREELLAYYRFTRRLVNLLDARGLAYRGHNVKYQGQLTLLMVKTANDEGGWICFINALSHQEAIKTFLMKLDEGTIEWRVDRYFGN